MNNDENKKSDSGELVSRSEEASKLIKIINTLYLHLETKPNKEIKSINIFLDAKWGDGKTVFVDHFFKPEIAKSGVLSFEYTDIFQISVWDYDYLNDPIEMFFDIVYKNEKIWIKVKKVLAEFGKSALKNIGLPKWLFDLSWVANAAKTAMEKCQLKANRGQVITMNSLLKNISEIFDDKFLIILEDLDRCKPEFARDVIEISKHLFNNENITLILVGDWIKINSNISGYKQLSYNDDRFDEYYLSKIVDCRFTLKTLDINSYLYNKYFLNITKKSFIYFLDTEDINDMYKKSSLSFNHIEEITKSFTIREQEKIMANFSNVIREREFYGASFAHYLELDLFLLANHLGLQLEGNIFNDPFIKEKMDAKTNYKYYILCAVFNLLNQTKNVNNRKFLSNFINLNKDYEVNDAVDMQRSDFIKTIKNFQIEAYIAYFRPSNSKHTGWEIDIVYEAMNFRKVLEFFMDWFKRNYNIF